MKTQDREIEGHSWPSTQISLLEGVRDVGDERAWGMFVDIYAPLIYRYCRHRGLQDADARDVAQTVLMRLRVALPNFSYDRRRGQFRGWLGTVTYREIRQYAKRAVRAGRGTGDGEIHQMSRECSLGSDWLDAFNAHICEVALARIRSEFDQETWCAFEQLWLRDAASGIVAATLGRSVGWVYKAKYRVLRRLREEVTFLAEDVACFDP